MRTVLALAVACLLSPSSVLPPIRPRQRQDPHGTLLKRNSKKGR